MAAGMMLAMRRLSLACILLQVHCAIVPGKGENVMKFEGMNKY